MRIVVLLSLIFLSGCVTTKYIPNEYFSSRHKMEVKVKPIPAPTHIETGNQSDSFIESVVSTAAQSSRAGDMRKMFAHIDVDAVRNDLNSSIKDKIKQFYDVEGEKRDLQTEVQITNWGWLLPTGAFGIRTGSYELQFSGTVKVFDINDKGKKIAFTQFTTREVLNDQLSKEETSRKVRRAVDEFAELAAEFLWRSETK